ncbi:flt3 receptor-interacting lectin-like [Arachis hypogaea]|uniref:flt3 receptor-interacting lectin-like n=1 Tax=Arachis hypogaea TaxID=3818 RepID=UPI000DED64C8|nr:lectin ConGF-like [Arachis hypogaea]
MGVSFNLHKFDPKHSKEIQFQGDATITDHHIIRLTNLDDDGNPLGNRVGRVLFSDPVHLYDHSGLRAGFETTFVFRISNPITLNIHLDLVMVLPSSLLVLKLKFLLNLLESFSASLMMHLTELLLLNSILFPTPILGIPIIRTSELMLTLSGHQSLLLEFHDAAITTAKITYNSAHKKLTVHVSTYLHSQPDTLTYDVDLSTKLPEKVKIGISASTGQFSQTTEILSWIFKSN